MIRRKETLGYIEFMRGKYTIQNKEYILNLIKQMTVTEKEGLLNINFGELWKKYGAMQKHKISIKVKKI